MVINEGSLFGPVERKGQGLGLVPHWPPFETTNGLREREVTEAEFGILGR